MDRTAVLFLCPHNAARSQIAEALLRHHGGDRFDVVSAGLRPSGVHPLALQVLAEAGIPVQGLHAKSIREVLGTARVRYAIILCDEKEEGCPRLYPFALETLSWPFDNPSVAQADETPIARFRRVRDEIEARLRAWMEALPRRA